MCWWSFWAPFQHSDVDEKPGLPVTLEDRISSALLLDLFFINTVVYWRGKKGSILSFFQDARISTEEVKVFYILKKSWMKGAYCHDHHGP
jgi:hypothetical protein